MNKQLSAILFLSLCVVSVANAINIFKQEKVSGEWGIKDVTSDDSSKSGTLFGLCDGRYSGDQFSNSPSKYFNMTVFRSQFKCGKEWC